MAVESFTTFTLRVFVFPQIHLAGTLRADGEVGGLNDEKELPKIQLHFSPRHSRD